MSENSEFLSETMEKLEKLMARVDELIEPVQTVSLQPKRAKTTVFDSKMGGYPFFTQEDPRGDKMEYAKCTNVCGSYYEYDT